MCVCDRLRREYLQLNVSDILEKDYNILTEKLMPIHPVFHTPVALELDPTKMASFQHYLPLDIFDDHFLDCRTPEEWLDLGLEDGIRKPVPARALIASSNEDFGSNQGTLVSLVVFLPPTTSSLLQIFPRMRPQFYTNPRVWRSMFPIIVTR